MSDTLLTPRLHIIGTQLNAWRDLSGGTASTFKSSSGTSNVAVASSSDTGAFGSSMLTMASTTQLRGVQYPGQNNWSDSASFSVLMRIIPRWTGAPTASEQGFFVAHAPWNSANIGVFAGMDINGKCYLGYYDQYGTNYINPNTDWPTAYTSFVSGTAVDLLFTWNGTTSAANFYVNGTLVTSLNPAAGSPSVNNQNIGSIAFGVCPNGGTLSNYDLNEVAVWNYALNSTDISNLTARSTFLATTAFDGTAYTNLSVSTVKTGTSFTQAGVSLTGTYDGSDRWTDHAVTDVRSGTVYKSNSTTNNRTGTAAIPSANYVLSGVPTDNTIGNVVLLTEAQAQVGITFGPNSTLTGTYDGSDRWTDLDQSTVLNNTVYEANGVSKTGTLIFSGAVTIVSSAVL